MTTTRSLLLAMLTGMLPCIAAAAPEPALVPEEVVKKAFGAVLSVKQDFEETGTFWNYCGALIDDKGLAVVPLKAMCYRLPPTFRDSKGGVIPFRKVLAIDSKRSLAVEFDKNDRTTGTRMMEVIQDQIRQIEETGKIHGVAQADIEAKKSGLERQSLMLTGDFRKILELDQKELLLWGDAPPGELLADIAFAQAETGDVKSAAETWKRASALATDSLHYQRLYEFFLSKHSDASEAKRVSELLWDLDEIDAPRRPREIR